MPMTNAKHVAALKLAIRTVRAAPVDKEFAFYFVQSGKEVVLHVDVKADGGSARYRTMELINKHRAAKEFGEPLDPEAAVSCSGVVVGTGGRPAFTIQSKVGGASKTQLKKGLLELKAVVGKDATADHSDLGGDMIETPADLGSDETPEMARLLLRIRKTLGIAPGMLTTDQLAAERRWLNQYMLGGGLGGPSDPDLTERADALRTEHTTREAQGVSLAFDDTPELVKLMEKIKTTVNTAPGKLNDEDLFAEFRRIKKYLDGGGKGAPFVPDLRERQLALKAERELRIAAHRAPVDVDAPSGGDETPSATERPAEPVVAAPADDGALTAKVAESVESLAVASDDEMTTLFEEMFAANASASGSATGSREITRGSAKLSLAGMAKGELQARARGKASVKHGDLLKGLEALAEVGIEVTAEGTISGTAGAKVGALSAEVRGKLEAVARAALKASAKANISAKGVEVDLAAEAIARAEVTGEVSATVDLGPIGASVGGTAHILAQAGGKAAGRFSATKDKLEMSGEIFVGALTKAELGFTVGGKVGEWSPFELGGSVAFEVGVGFHASGSFTIDHGKLVLVFDVGGALGIGLGASGKISIDVGEIAQKVANAVAKLLMDKLPGKDPFRYVPLVTGEEFQKALLKRLVKDKKGPTAIASLTLGKFSSEAITPEDAVRLKAVVREACAPGVIDAALTEMMAKPKYRGLYNAFPGDVDDAVVAAVQEAWGKKGCDQGNVEPPAVQVRNTPAGPQIASLGIAALSYPFP